MQHINIKEYVQQEKIRLRMEANNLDIIPSLTIIDTLKPEEANPASQIYMKNKIKDFNEMNWKAEICNIQDYRLQDILQNCITSGVIVQLPLGNGVILKNKDIPILKDADGFNPDSNIMPATVRGIIDYLDTCGFQYRGKFAVVLGRSEIVGKPMAQELLNRNMTIAVCHSKTPIGTRRNLLRSADLVVSAVGKLDLFFRWEVPNAIVIDVGINRNEDGKICGDFVENMNAVNDKIWSTPVPGGVGLLTRLGLLKNCLELAERAI